MNAGPPVRARGGEGALRGLGRLPRRLLMLPVLAWVGFILLMTLALVRLNPQV